MKFIYDALLLLALSFSLTSVHAMSQPVPKGTSTDLPSPRLHLVGDSTMADKVNLAYPERGWGQLLPEFMLPELSIINHAANGRSTLRFLNEGRWQLLVTELKPGDYVLIQFGHNDQKQDDPSRYAAADSTYPQLLSRFIAEVRAKDAIPMLATPICRRSFNAKGQLENNLASFADAMRKVAVKEKVALFDLNVQSCADISRFGLAASQAFFIQVPAGLYQKFPEGKTDNTHLNTQGASWIAQLFVRELKKQQHPLAKLVWRELL
ncbi:rhamnogalacturonan acetylesterase [Rheinheimera riviphila]|uniref:Rhamnogalacturonan acetylesterase n=1 Tax=Rheinheimera riviphila TaxID=1834037 RepID=A0A437QFZ9_9GAMM|nr:rhamnogalacturonan acetylesterase [Rheinheimera riviphila]RVU33260.1 rhamnogalacturonan acetylesterase [Rheinheimera riviphila]